MPKNTTDAKAFNEMLKSLKGSPKPDEKELRPPQFLKTNRNIIKSWNDVRVGFTLDESKGWIPANGEAHLLNEKSEEEYIAKVLEILKNNPQVKGVDGFVINLSVPDGKEDESKTLVNRAKHLCGGRDYHFDKTRAKYAGCIISTLTGAALIAEQGVNKLFLRRYNKGFLHIVITTSGLITGQAFQRNRDLVTQYPSTDPKKHFDNASVKFKNEDFHIS